MRTRCKFVVQWVKKFAWNGEEVHLSAQYDPKKNPEDVSFSAATPSGEMTITVTNPDVVGKLKPGDAYYVELIPVEPAA